MTSTSLKSPISGTVISTLSDEAELAGFGVAGSGGAVARCALEEGGAATEGLAAGAAAFAGGGDCASLSITSRGESLDTLSPSFTISCLTMPAADDGISIDALSLSTVISD